VANLRFTQDTADEFLSTSVNIAEVIHKSILVCFYAHAKDLHR